MRWIVGASLKFRFIVVGLAAAMMFVGLVQLRHMPVDVFPEFAPPRVEIQTACLGLTATEVESLVTVPLEQALNGLPNLDVIRSKSVPQLSSIELIFKSSTDLLHARQVVQERLSAVTNTLPTWAAPPLMIQPLSATSRVMQIGLTTNTLSLMDMSMISYWKIRARLLRVPGVADVQIWGEQLKMLQVQADPARLRANNVSLEQVMTVTSDSLDAGLLKFSEGGGVIGTGGFVDSANQRLTVRHVLPIVSPADLAQVPVGTKPDGSHLVLGDVANVVEDHQPLIGDAVVNNSRGLLLVVQKLPWGNTLQVTHGVQQALEEIRPGLPGITFDTRVFRAADFIDTAIHNLTRALLLGSLLVVFILLMFLFSWRSALISVIAIPLSLLAAMLVLDHRGATINTMVLAGLVIAVGVVVDDAIIDIENIVRRLRQCRKEGSATPTAKIILEGSLEVRSAIVYATLIDVTTLVPVLFMKGLSGSFFRPLAVSYGLAVLASMVVALTVTPALGLILLARVSADRHESPLVGWLHRAYGRVLSRIIRTPRPAYLTVGVFMLLGAVVLPQLGQSLFPRFKERDFLIHFVTKPGTSDPEELRIVQRVSRELRAIPGVRSFGAHIGQALAGEEVAGVNFGENWISVAPSANYDKTVAAVNRVVAGYPGLFRNVETYLNERIEEVLAGSSYPVLVRIFGDDLGVLRKKADEVQRVLSHVSGVADAQVELQEDVPQVQVTVDLASAQRYGIKPGDVRRAAATLVAGEEVGDVFRDGKAYDVQVWSTPGTRHSLTDIQQLPIDTPGGGHIRLADVADVRIGPTPNVVHRVAASRSIDVGADVRGRDLGSVVGDIHRRLKTVNFPLQYHAEVLGEYAERQATQGRLVAFAMGAAAGVFLLLWAAFRSFRLACLSYFALPTALVGGVLAAYLGDGIISLGALVGFFTILGIAARNGIMLINHCQHLEHQEGQPFGEALVLRGARERLSPILMTASATGLALIPLVVSGSIPGHEIEYPMAVVILGGLTTSTLLNLFIVPSLYLRFAKGWRRRHPIRNADPGDGESPANRWYRLRDRTAHGADVQHAPTDRWRPRAGPGGPGS
jgi:CzcA family heavy metal efflux pump